MLDFGFVEFRGLRPPNLLIVNSHLSIVNGQGGICGFILVFIEILAALGLHFCTAGGMAEMDGVDHAVGEGFGEHAGGIGAVG